MIGDWDKVHWGESKKSEKDSIFSFAEGCKR